MRCDGKGYSRRPSCRATIMTTAIRGPKSRRSRRPMGVYGRLLNWGAGQSRWAKDTCWGPRPLSRSRRVRFGCVCGFIRTVSPVLNWQGDKNRSTFGECDSTSSHGHTLLRVTTVSFEAAVPTGPYRGSNRAAADLRCRAPHTRGLSVRTQVGILARLHFNDLCS